MCLNIYLIFLLTSEILQHPSIEVEFVLRSVALFSSTLLSTLLPSPVSQLVFYTCTVKLLQVLRIYLLLLVVSYICTLLF